MYATASELLTAFGARELAQITTPERFDVVDDAGLEVAILADDADGDEATQHCLDTIAQALSVTDGIINSYLSVRYTLPLAVTPAVLKENALDLARFELHRAHAPEDVKARRDMAISYLKDLAAGRAKLGEVDIDSGSASNTGGISIVSSFGRTFDYESLESFAP